jgi:hypothetical protein
MFRAFQANIVGAYGDELLPGFELRLTHIDKLPHTGIASFGHTESQVPFQSDIVGATRIHASTFFQTPPDKKHQARVVSTRSRQ